MRSRFVSLVPSSTETLLALGADVVACSRFCEQPALAHVGGTKNPDVAAIVALAPDAVVMDVEENRAEDAAALRAAGLDVLVTDVCSLDDAARAVSVLADAAGAAPPDLSVPVVARDVWATALVPIWRRPWMVLGPGTYGASLLAHLGINVIPRGGGKYPEITPDGAVRPVPDLVLVPSEPYSFREQHLDELRVAYPSAQLIEVDGQDLFWWGVRTPAAVERLWSALAEWHTSR